MKNLIIYFFERPITSFMLFGGLFALGFLSLPMLPVSLMPASENPAITVITRHTGISPSKIEESLTKPIEEQINGVGGIQTIYSSSEEGESRINILFQSGENISKKSLEVRSKIDLIRSTFSREVEEPMITRYDPTDKPIFIIKLESNNLSLKDLRDIAEYKLKKRLERIDGISEIQVGGGFQREINIDIDQGRMNYLNLNIEDILERIKSSNVSLPSGKVEAENKWINTRIVGKFEAVDQLKEVNITDRELQGLIKLKDIALVKDGFKDIENISRENGKEIVTLYIQKAGEANILQVCESIKEELGEFNFPNIVYTISYDQSSFIKNSIERVEFSALIGGLVAVFILLIFLKNFRATLVVAISIPLSIFITFFGMYLMKIGLNIMSLSGLALGIGILIDNSIVILDRIFHLKKSEPQNFNSSDAAIELGGEVVASTLTNIAVFIPIFLGSIELKQLYGGLAYTVSFSMVTSLICSLLFLPVLTKTIFSKKEHYESLSTPKWISQISIRLNNSNNILNKVINSIFNYRKIYLKVFFFTIRKSKYLLSISIVIILICLIGFTKLKTEYLDPLDSGEIQASVELETGTHLTATNEIVRRIEDTLKSQNQVEKVSSKVEKWHADLYIKLKPSSERSETASETIQILKDATADIKDAFIYFVESGSEESSKELDIEFIGDDMKTLQSIASEVAGQTSTIPEIQDTVLRFREGKDEIVLNIDTRKSGIMKIPSQSLGSELKTMLQGSIPTKFISNGREVDIRVRFANSDRISSDQVISYFVTDEEGKTRIPIKELISISNGKSETRIYRKNKRKLATITAKIGTGDLGSVSKKIEAILKTYPFPPNYYYEFGKNLKKMRANQIEMASMILVSIFLIYCILASLFQDYVLPFIIIISIPLGLIGVILVLLIFNLSLNVSVYIGIIMLSGIVVNNGIMLVDHSSIRLKKNIERIKKRKITKWLLLRSITKASLERIRPIMMTTLTTVLALVPALLDFGEGSQLWRPLSITVFFGLSLSTILSLIFIPLLLHQSNKWRYIPKEI
jgi:HAE1 family hydrophobic/amphiphilic exporter-1